MEIGWDAAVPVALGLSIPALTVDGEVASTGFGAATCDAVFMVVLEKRAE